jgi:hypothetical protein
VISYDKEAKATNATCPDHAAGQSGEVREM